MMAGESGAADLDQLFEESAGSLARAARFLDAGCHAESRCAYLACRALDAFEDLAGDPAAAAEGILRTAAYLLGASAQLPDTKTLTFSRRSDRIEQGIVRALPALRRAIASLHEPAQERIHKLVSRMAEAMMHALRCDGRNASAYGERVLGEASAYAFATMGVSTDGPADFAALGALVQAANDLRDLDFDHAGKKETDVAKRRLDLNLSLAMYAPQAIGVLRQAVFRRLSRARAATTYLCVTTSRFLMRMAGRRAPFLLRYPACAALAALASQRLYIAVVNATDKAILDCIVAACVGRAAPATDHGAAPVRAISPLQSRFEARIAAAHPDPSLALVLRHAAALIHAALALCSALPNVALRRMSRTEGPAAILLVSDYLISCAVGKFSRIGPEALEEAGWSTAALVRACEGNGATGDSSGEIAGLLGYLVGKALGRDEAYARRCSARHRRISALLHRADRRFALRGRLGTAIDVPLWP